MNTLVVLSLVVCAASAGIIPALHHGVHYGGASEQHHSQDEAGNYAYGYSDPNSYKEETGVAGYHGNAVKGSYSYVAPDGQVIVNDYYADENGFRSSLAPTAAHDVHPAPEYAHPVGHAVAHVGHVGVAHHGVAHHGVAVAHHAAAPYAAASYEAPYAAPYAAPYHHGPFSYGFATGHPVYAAPAYVAAPAYGYAGYH